MCSHVIGLRMTDKLNQVLFNSIVTLHKKIKYKHMLQSFDSF